MPNNRITVLDSLRGIAAVAVMLFHFTFFYNQVYSNLNISKHLTVFWGHYGVQLFFMISGFVIFMSIKNLKSPLVFLKKRFYRLYPTYWICLTITSLFLVFFPNDIFKITFQQFIGNVTMFQGLLKIDNLDGSYWSLLPELLFYIMIAFLLLFNLQGHIVRVCSVWLILIFLNLFRPSIVEVLLNLRFGVFFITGIMFYRIYMKQNSFVEYLLIIVSLILSYFIFDKLETTLVFLLLTSVFYLFITNRLNFLDIKFLRYLGAISYPLYLLHQSIGFLIIRWGKKHGFNDYFLITLAIITSFLLANLVYYRFEKPFMKFISKS